MALRQAQGEGAGAAKEVGDAPRAFQRALRAVRQRALARQRRLQEAARRRRDPRLPEGDLRRAALDDDLAVVGYARQIEPLRGLDELAPRGRIERPGAAKIEIEPAERRRRLDVERLAQAAQSAGERPRRGNRAVHRRAEQRAGVDGDDVVGARAHEADALAAVLGDARVKRRAPPALAMRVDERADLGLDARALERANEAFALPLAVEARAHVLGRAAAANAEIGADGRGPLGAGVRRISRRRARLPSISTIARSPGRAPGTIVPSSATPSPRSLKATIVTVRVASSMPRGIQEFARAVAAQHGRGDEAEARPAELLDAAAHRLAGRARARRGP